MNATNQTIRLVIADDHLMTLKGLQHTLSSERDIAVIAAVRDGQDLVAAVQEHKPHVVLTDLKMNAVNGPEACLKIRSISPETNIIVYSMYDSGEMVRQMRSLGVRGYLLKTGDCREIRKAVRMVYNGGEYFGDSIRERTDRFFHSGTFGRGRGDAKQEFTEHELQIIRLLCQDYSTKQIAAKLNLKERTVQAQKEKIEEKMDVRGVVGIVVYAMSNWLLA